MQTWAKRGVRTALVTGGLLMLGTGIASADEDVNPDKPASPLDGRLIVPLNLDNNQIGSPLGPIDAPKVHTDLLDVGVSDVTGNQVDVVLDAVEPITGDLLMGNEIAGDVVAPIDISGNAIAVLGDAAVTNTSDQSVATSRPMWGNGVGGTLNDNMVDLDYALPIQITGNAIAGLGNATSENESTQHACTTGDIGTDGTGGLLSGNVVASHDATPIQITGNAVGAGGLATTESDASTVGEAGGAIFTQGVNGNGSGNGVGAPLAVPLAINDNSIGGAATTATWGESEAEATAGRQHENGDYIVTNGEGGTIAGTAAQTPVALPGKVDCNAVAGLADSVAMCENSNEATAGGGNRTEGINGLVSGTVGNVAAATPAEVFSNAGAVGGTAVAEQVNEVKAEAGGDNHTHGTGGSGSGSVIGAEAAGPIDVFSNAVAGAGDATATTTSNTSTSEAGGFSGSSGDDSTGGGSMVDVPIALPAEGFGNVVGVGGNAATGEVQENKVVVSSGGDTSTQDDGGLLAANLVQGAVSGPVQIMGNGAGAAGNSTSNVDVDNTITAGGDSTATGTAGTLAGNIGQVLVSLPAQVFANNVTAGGIGTATGDVDTLSAAGGDAMTDGTAGTGSGNVVSAPAASPVQLFGDTIAALGLSSAAAQGETSSLAGGDVETAGTGGLLDGNVVTGQAMPIIQGFGDAVSALGGINDATGENCTTVDSGGDVATNGDFGTISGNLVNAEAGVIGELFGDAVAAIGGDSIAAADHTATATDGGTSTTSGVSGFLSGLNGTLPAGVNLSLFGVPVEVLAEALAEADNVSSYTVGESDPAVNLAMGGDSLGGLPITSLPKLPSLSELPMAGTSRANEPVPGIDQLGSLTGLLGGLGGATGGSPVGDPVAGLLGGGLPALPGAPTGHLPNVPGLPGGSFQHLPLVANHGDILGGVTEQMPALPGQADSVDDVTGPVPGTGMVESLPGLAGGLGHGLPGGGPKLPSLPSLPGGHVQPKVGSPVPSVPGLDVVTKLIGSVLGGGAGGGLVPALPALPGGSNGGVLPALPALLGGSNGGVLPALPALPGGSNGGVLPALPALPGGSNGGLVPALPVGANGGLLPALPGGATNGGLLPALPGAGGTGLPLPMVQTPALTKLPVQPALSGLDTKSVLNPNNDSASLSDTKSKLAKLLGEHPIG